MAYGMEDERETVTFTAEEWRHMLSDPVYFGYACQQGHALREDDPAVIALGCPVCFQVGEVGDSLFGPDGEEPTPQEWKEFERWADSLRSFPLIRCGKCKGEHVGVGAVRRCYGV